MGQTTRPIVNMSGGEASPNLYGRTDVVPYFACAKTLENVIVTHFGSALRTPGTKFVANSKASGAIREIPFIFSTGDSYILEFGNLYMRVFRTGGSVVETSKTITGITKANPGVVTSNSHGYANGDIVDISEVLGMTQVNGKRYKVANQAANTFELQDEDGNNVNTSAYGTYTSAGIAERVYQIVTPYATADLSKIRFTQQADTMYLDCDGYAPRKLSRLGTTSWTLATYTYDTFNWPPFLDINTTATTITPSGTTGSVTLTASAALFSSGHVGSYWKIIHSTTIGYALVTAYTDTTHVTATVIVTLGNTTATDDWHEGAWSAVQGYPCDVKFYEQRLYHCSTTNAPLDIWGSTIDEYENYNTGTGTSGAITDEDAVNYQIGSNQVDKILWMYPTQILNLGTAGGPFTASSGSSSDPITSTNISVKQQNENGVANLTPVRIGSFVCYVERSGKVLGQFAYNLDSDSYLTENLTYLSDHILGDGVVSMALQRYPYNILWCVLADGTVATLTREQKNDVKGWARQEINGFVEDVAVIPNGVEDQVWLVVKRTINSVTRRHIEYVMPHDFGTIENAFFVQGGLTYDGTAVSSLSGLSHLEARSVQVLTDGSVHPNCTVTSGTITLQWSASVIHVGLGYESIIETLDIEAGSATGTAMAKPKFMNKVNVRLKDSVGCSVGTADVQDVVAFRSSSMDMDAPVPMFSGDKEVVFPGGWEKEKTVLVKQSQPLPFHLLAIYPKLAVSD
jgi:hypothetical protein